MERAGAGLGKVLERSLHQAPAGEAPVLAWPLACGSAVAERTRAVAFAGGVLRVEVPDDGWRYELRSLAPRYLALLNRYVTDEVNRIEFVVTPR
jgi:predicted nucleic acid-binding Zn ribbon protein